MEISKMGRITNNLRPNDDSKRRMIRNVMQTFNAVADQDAKIRHETLEGRSYMVVPVVMMVEGVHTGSNGPLYYPRSELSKTPMVWDTKPVVVYHPEENGQAISACQPAVISKRKVGMLMNTTWEDGRKGQPGKLKSEAWLEINRLEEVDDRVLESIRNREMVEVSTGLYTDNEQTDGEWKGEPYEAIARYYRPDHLAILPDQIGACSVEDGAGLLRNTEESFNDRQQCVQDALNRRYPQGENGMLGSPWINDLYDDFVVFQNKGKTFKQDYTEDEDGDVTLTGVPVEVTKSTVYKTKNGETVNTEGEDMTRKQKVSALIKNERSEWLENDREFLMGLDDRQLDKIVATINIGPTKVDDGHGDDGGEPTVDDPSGQIAPKKGGTKTAGEAKNAKKKMDPADDDESDDSSDDDSTCNTQNGASNIVEYVNNAPPEMRDLLNQGMRMLVNQKGQMVKAILANKNCKFTKTQLMNKGVEELEAIAAMAGTPAKKSTTNSDYWGMNDVGPQEAAEKGGADIKPLALPTMNFEHPSKNKGNKSKATA